MTSHTMNSILISCNRSPAREMSFAPIRCLIGGECVALKMLNSSQRENVSHPFMDSFCADHFQTRMEKLKTYLSERAEQSIVLVVHRDVIESLIGRSPANCEFATISL